MHTYVCTFCESTVWAVQNGIFKTKTVRQLVTNWINTEWYYYSVMSCVLWLIFCLIKSWQCQINPILLLDAWIFLDAHKRSVSVALDAVKNFTFHSRSFDFVISLTTKLSTKEYSFDLCCDISQFWLSDVISKCTTFSQPFPPPSDPPANAPWFF